MAEGAAAQKQQRAALAKQAAVAKCHASDTAMKVATEAVQLFGAAGISGDYPINRYFRDAKVLQIVEGTQQVQRNIIMGGENKHHFLVRRHHLDLAAFTLSCFHPRGRPPYFFNIP